MIAWENRTLEERTLLNPAFCSTLLWHAARGREAGGKELLSIEETFVVLPLVLPASTREALPGAITTSLPVWLAENPIEQRRIAERAKALLPFTRTALTFGAMHGLLRLEGTRVMPSIDSGKVVKKVLKQASEEVRNCALKAEFVGKWFGKAGSSSTVLALLGVRP
ncbi:three component ABC system middle component [Nitrosospira sp. NRS527]|uniref:three component ABC system middle component n=1 Tax=Nitrosospira sp. NRS527 TaxID=155925 RepID=UPI001AF32F10|nr:three component ABC system middle component [Nitrosospira sp. NRS527]BCT67391.1 hypothetical protein NNRS527_00973 [Nitrosospira sp. NRS527]